MNSNATLKIQENFRKRTVNGTRKPSGLVRNQTYYAKQDMEREDKAREVTAEQKQSVLILPSRI